MRVNGIRCDGCGKEHLFAPTLIVDMLLSYMPKDWFLVLHGQRSMPDEEPWAFCSQDCLRRHPLTPREKGEVRPL